MKPKKICDDAYCFIEKESCSKESEFEKSLKGLMSEYGMTLNDVKEIFGISPSKKTYKSAAGNKKKILRRVDRKPRSIHPAKKIASYNRPLVVSKAGYRSAKGLLLHKPALFDLCPELLTLDDAQGDKLFREFIRHFNYSKSVFDWAQHLKLYCWLQSSIYADALESKHLDAVMTAAVSLWCEKDRSRHRAVAVTHRNSSSMMMGRKGIGSFGQSRIEVLPNTVQLPWSNDFAFCAMPEYGHPMPQDFKAIN